MPHPNANAILSQLPTEELQFLLPHMTMVSLKKGAVLFEPGGTIDHYYFPLTCALELAVDLADGNTAATAVINMNGIYPLHLVGDSHSHNRATVRSPGLCYRVPAWVIQEELRRNQSFLWLLLGEAVHLFERTSVESACLRHHSLEQVTAKLILLSMDHGDSSVVSLTQQEMANSLGGQARGRYHVNSKIQATPPHRNPPRRRHGARPDGPGAVCLRLLQNTQRTQHNADTQPTLKADEPWKRT